MTDTTSPAHARLQELLASVLTEDTIDEERARSALEEMVSAVEELRVAEEELTVQGEHLAASTEMIDAERARYAELFEFAPDAYVETDELGKIVEANRAAEALLGLSLRRLVGKLLVSFVDPDERRRFRTLLSGRVAIESEQIFEIESRNGDRRTVGLVRSAANAAEDGADRVRWLLRDISERLMLEGRVDQLLEEVDLLRSLDELQGFTDEEDPFERSLANILTMATHLAGRCEIGVTLSDRRTAHDVVGRGQIAAALDEAQRKAGAGPCIEAFTTGRLVRGPVDQWPDLASTPEAANVVEVVALPMSAHDVRGVMNVYVCGRALEEHTLRLLVLLAEQAATVLFTAQLLHASSGLIGHLNRALESRAVIEQAKGLLMAQHRCDADAAFTLLRQGSQRENVKLHEIAQRIVASSAAG